MPWSNRMERMSQQENQMGSEMGSQMQSQMQPNITRLHDELRSFAPHGFAPPTLVLIESRADEILRRLDVLRARRFFWSLQTPQTNIFSHNAVQKSAQNSFGTQTIEHFYADVLPEYIWRAEQVESALQGLRERSIAAPDEQILSSQRRFRNDVLSLWGIVQEFPALKPRLEQCLESGSLPSSEDEGGMYFRSAWLWFCRRQGRRAAAALLPEVSPFAQELDVAAPRLQDFFAGEARAPLFALFMQSEQPFPRFRDRLWQRYPLETRLRWWWAERMLERFDALHESALERVCAEREGDLRIGGKTGNP
jgi:hypothetical protein